MKKDGNILLEVTEYTDPYCTWCWGSEPVLRRIAEAYEGRVRIRFKMGGLVADIRQFYDPLNEIGGENWYKQVAEHWLEASLRHGMPVDERVWYDIKDDFISTYPANIAYKSAELQDEGAAIRFLRRMREATSAERMAIHRLDVQAALAEEIGLDPGRFIQELQNGKAEEAFGRDLLECRTMGITGFPTFLVRNPAGRKTMLNGYQPFQSFERAFIELTDGEVEPKTIEPGEDYVLTFVRKYGKVAAKEISEVFNLTMESAQEILNKLKEKGPLREKQAGNGFFYLI